MSSGRARPVSSQAAAPAGRFGDGDWRSTMRVFREEVQRLREENEAFRATRGELSAAWSRVLEGMDFFSGEFKSLQGSVVSLLEEERRKVADTQGEISNLLLKVKALEEKCSSEAIEISRLTDLVEVEKERNNAVVSLFEEKLAEKEDQYQTELGIREKQIEELQKTLEDKCGAYEISLAEMKSTLDFDRIRWERQKEAYEAEIARLMLYAGKQEHSQRVSSESAKESALHCSENSSFVTLQVPLEDSGRSATKKSRLEIARQQRRFQECKKDPTPVASLNILSEPK
ncbi:hypothetical protein ERJ75_001656300 [Trypanosoma vivax]|uniref:Uncharacterized protein n=1 Tax=Trypanosoma vivax (strain Y486) TaxID=1055687 RepID=G0UDA7_TRYVY|nr:hypothetical protein TRVL_03514 [Trypanosoma vivax]KAH8605066.1 hypothetical protein ERJ75_001656300 [Trypanosoma vivax]CCC53818.1 conserved hypothetical protein [Trypanosoma vivax Y486]